MQRISVNLIRHSANLEWGSSDQVAVGFDLANRLFTAVGDEGPVALGIQANDPLTLLVGKHGALVRSFLAHSAGHETPLGQIQ